MQFARNTLAPICKIQVRKIRICQIQIHKIVGVVSLLALLPALAFAANTSYKVEQINPTGSTGTFAVALNNDNAVVGHYVDSSGVVQGYKFAGGKFTLINFPKADKFTRANGINDTDFIVGDFIGTDGFYHGFTLSKGTYTQYDLNLGTLSTSIFGVNNAGDFVGTTGTEGFVNIGGTVTEFYGSGTDATYPSAINNNEEVVGQFYDSSNNSHCFDMASNGTITEIVYPGALQTACSGINDSGVITGWYENSSDQYYAFEDNAGVFTSLDFINASGINNAGTFVGYYYGPGASGAEGYGYLASPHTMKSIATVTVPGSESTSTFGLNDAGVIVGQYTNAKGTTFGLELEGTKKTNIDDPAGLAGTTACYGINTANTIVGYYETTATGATQGFMYSGGTFTDIGPAGALNSVAVNINASSVIAGWYEDSSDIYHAFTYNGTTYTTIDAPNATYTEGWGINANGDVTLIWGDANGYEESSLYNGTTFTVIDVPGALQSVAHSINSSGNIVYSWYDYYGNGHGAILENGSYYVFDDPNGAGSTRADGLNDNNLIVGRYLQTGSTVLYDGYKATN
jgi:probable HAF family extracellular repeat protein